MLALEQSDIKLAKIHLEPLKKEKHHSLSRSIMIAMISDEDEREAAV